MRQVNYISQGRCSIFSTGTLTLLQGHNYWICHLSTSTWSIGLCGIIYVDGTATSEFTLVTIRYIHLPHHGQVSILVMDGWFTCLSSHVNRPSHSWGKANSNSGLKTSRSRSWVWSNIYIYIQIYIYILLGINDFDRDKSRFSDGRGGGGRGGNELKT